MSSPRGRRNPKVVISPEEEETLNHMTKVIILRGLIDPNYNWWAQSDKLVDKSGILFFNHLVSKHQKPFIPIKLLHVSGYLVTDVRYIEIILNHSPYIFNVGELKYNFFKSFMKYNVGVSTGCPWERRRQVNTSTLFTDGKHCNVDLYDKFIYGIIHCHHLPSNFEDFLNLAKKIATKIVFNKDTPAKPIFDVLAYANSFKPFEKKDFKVPEKLHQAYLTYMKDSIQHPVKDSLVGISTIMYQQMKSKREMTELELVHQIPHWIFPIASAIHTTVPRLLLLLYNHPDKLQQVATEINEIYSPHHPKTIYHLKYLKKCILEAFRINNNVVSLFRKLEQDFTFDKHYSFKKGSQFFILTNPILRSEKYFDNPDEFIPERWHGGTDTKKYAALSFSRGPQKCPGKEITIFVITSFIVHLFEKAGITQNIKRLRTKKINVTDISHAINPCEIQIAYT